MFVCVCSYGGLVEDVWTKPTLEEARLSLAATWFNGEDCQFDEGKDDARVFELGDDGIGVEVYSFHEVDFTFVPGSDNDGESNGEYRFIEQRYSIRDMEDPTVSYDGEIYNDPDVAKQELERILREESEAAAMNLAIAEVDRDGDFLSFIEE